MRRKALIIGVLPSPFEGPWIPLGSGESWVYRPEVDYGGAVAIDVLSNGSTTRHRLRGGDVVIRGDRARAVVLYDVPGARIVTVNIYG